MRRVVRGDGDPPFTPWVAADLARWSDGPQDLSEGFDPEAQRIIVAAEWPGGFAAVDRMTYPDFVGARQLIAERRYGAPLRAALQAQQAREDAAFDSTVAALRRQQPTPAPPVDTETERARLKFIEPRPITDEVVA